MADTHGVPLGVGEEGSVAFSAADQAEVDFEQWQEYFKVALDGAAAAVDGHSPVAWLVSAAEQIADAAVATVRERRAAIDAQKAQP